MGTIILIIAILLFSIISPIYLIGGIIINKSFKEISEYFYSIAFSIDQLGNAMGGPIMNKFLLKKNPTKLYGNPDETISHVTGVNYKSEKLTSFGYFIAHCLDCIEKDHVEKAADINQIN